MMTTSAFRVFGRDKYGDDIDGPWWPLYHRDGPIVANSAEDAIAVVRERLEQTEPQWVEIAAIPYAAWEAEDA